MTLKCTSFKWNCQHIATRNITLQYLSCDCPCIYIDPVFAMFVRIEVELEQEPNPFVEDTVTEPRQQGKQPPFDHVDKNPFPS